MSAQIGTTWLLLHVSQSYEYEEVWMYDNFVIYNDEDRELERDVIFTSAVFMFTIKTGHHQFPYLVIFELVKFDGTEEQAEVDKLHKFDLVDAEGLKQYNWTGEPVCHASLATPPHPRALAVILSPSTHMMLLCAIYGMQSPPYLGGMVGVWGGAFTRAHEKALVDIFDPVQPLRHALTDPDSDSGVP